MKDPVTRICRYTTDAIYVRGASLAEELIGGLTFTEMMYFHWTGRRPSAGETRILDAVLVTLMEHGITPSVIAARMVYDSSPDALQGAMAAGLLAVGSNFVGTMEGCAALLEEILSAPEGEAERAQAIARRHREQKRPVPGFGHPHHKPDDPRSPKLLAIAEGAGVPGRHIRALRLLAAEVDAAFGRHLTINATGAVAALLGEIGIPQPVMRGVAVVSRAAGLVGHLREEQTEPAARFMWNLVAERVSYEGK